MTESRASCRYECATVQEWQSSTLDFGTKQHWKAVAWSEQQPASDVVFVSGVEYRRVRQCQECKHWADKAQVQVMGNGGKDSPHASRCLLAETQPGGLAQWDRPQAVSAYSPGTAIRGGGSLITPAHFGCNQWEEKA